MAVSRKKNKDKNAPSLKRTGLVIGLVLCGLFFWRTREMTHLSFVNARIENQSSTQSSPPTFIYIPNLSFGIRVEQTGIRGGIWQIAPDSASHLKISANPGENGNIIIYAPNSEERFGKILNLKENDIITITSFDGTTHAYTVQALHIVNPNNSEVLKNEGERLTLYTSLGFGGAKRFVVVATPNAL